MSIAAAWLGTLALLMASALAPPLHGHAQAAAIDGLVPPSGRLARGEHIDVEVTVDGSDRRCLEARDLPSGVSTTFDPRCGDGRWTSTMTVGVGASTPTGTHQLIVVETDSDGKTTERTWQLEVVASSSTTTTTAPSTTSTTTSTSPSTTPPPATTTTSPATSPTTTTSPPSSPSSTTPTTPSSTSTTSGSTSTTSSSTTTTTPPTSTTRRSSSTAAATDPPSSQSAPSGSTTTAETTGSQPDPSDGPAEPAAIGPTIGSEGREDAGDELRFFDTEIRWNTPEQMSLNETVTIELVVNPENASGPLPPITAPGPVQEREVETTCWTTARLSGSPGNFTITRATGETQNLCVERTGRWAWLVEAQQKGTHTLTLAIEATSDDGTVSSEVYTTTITIRVGLWSQLLRPITENLGLVLAAFFGAIGTALGTWSWTRIRPDGPRAPKS